MKEYGWGGISYNRKNPVISYLSHTDAQIRAMLPKLRNSINNHRIWYWLWYCINSWLTIKSKRTATTEESWFFEDSWYNEYRDLNDLMTTRWLMAWKSWWKCRGNQLTNSLTLFWCSMNKKPEIMLMVIKWLYTIQTYLYSNFKKNPFIINSDKNQFNNPNG